MIFTVEGKRRETELVVDTRMAAAEMVAEERGPAPAAEERGEGTGSSVIFNLILT